MALDVLIHRKRSSWLERFTAAPSSTLANTLYAQRQRLLDSRHQASSGTRLVRIVCVSDTHDSQPHLPDGDILIHAGDLTQSGTLQELQTQLDWLDRQTHAHKIVIAGNHDIVLDSARSSTRELQARRQAIRWGSIIYLEDSAASIKLAGGKSLVLFGSPYTRKHGDWAFQFDKEDDVFTGRVPPATDVLVTHSPPRFHLDVAGWGDMNLLRELWRTRPRLHIFGHVHEGAGRDILLYDRFEELYESVRIGDSAVLAVSHMALLLILAYAGVPFSAARTVLINASAVGGLLDRPNRKAYVVELGFDIARL